MGAGWRRFTEKMRESTGMTGKLKGHLTSNERNRIMLKEAGNFAAHLKDCQRAITGLKLATEDILKTTKNALSAPLPHVYEESAASAGGSARPTTSIGGPGFKPDSISPLSQKLSQQMESQVMVPLTRWQDIHATLQTRMKDLEALRLEVDSRKHTVTDLTAAVDKLREKNNKAGGDPKLDVQIEETVKKLAHKEGKLALAAQTFEQGEQQLHDDLSTLIKDAQWLSHYVGCALKLGGECLLAGASAFDSVKRPSSAATSPRSPQTIATPSPVAASRDTPSSGVSDGSSLAGGIAPMTPAGQNPFSRSPY